MNIVTPTFKILEQESGLEGIYKQIETAGRTCYASTPIEGKAVVFVNRMMQSNHGAMLEHGTVYLHISPGASITGHKYRDNPYSKYVEIRLTKEPDVHKYITTNLRVMFENRWLDDLQYLCEPTIHHEKRITVLFNTQIAVSREFNRHRVNSVAEQSTRYCNYCKDKFGNEITINRPSFLKEVDDQYILNRLEESKDSLKYYCHKIATGEEANSQIFQLVDYWLFANLVCEFSYLNMIRLGAQPQEARSVLPLDTSTELIHTAFISDWEHFFNLRSKGTTGKPHPDAKILAEPLREEFINKGFISY